MKRGYVKPDITFESFSLSTSIATGCEVKLEGPVSWGCGIEIDGGYILFLENITGCDTPVEDGSLADKMCYHVPYDSNNVFDS